MIEVSNEELTRIYMLANKIPEGKAPPISTEKIFAAMRECLKIGAESK